MASYFLRSKHISRGKGARVTRAAAYRAGERIRDERTGETYDHSDRQDVAYKEVVLPADLAGRPDMAWTQERATLWNAMEHAGARRNSRLAREFLVLVPPELTPEQRVRLVRGFAQGLADRYRCAVDTALHTPRPGADRRNHHAHLLMTVRETSPEGLGPRTTLELGGRERHLRGLGPSRDEYLSIRKHWAQLTNEALHQAGLAARVDHRSFAAQGIDREPTPSIPEKVFYAERRLGAGTMAGDEIRARHRERLEARGKGGEELERVAQRQKRELRQRAIEALRHEKPGETKVPWTSLTREQRNAIRRQQYNARPAMPPRGSHLAIRNPAVLEIPTTTRSAKSLVVATTTWSSEGLAMIAFINDISHGIHGMELAFVLSLIAMCVGVVQEHPSIRALVVSPILVFIMMLLVGVLISFVVEPLTRSLGRFLSDAVDWPIGTIVCVLACHRVGRWAGGREGARASGAEGTRHRRGAVVSAAAPALASRQGWFGFGSRQARSQPQPQSGTPTLAGVPVPLQDETKHFKIIGATGTGKSTAIRELLNAALKRGDRAIIADPDGSYLDAFYDAARGDVILNPFEPDALKWDLFGEIIHSYDVEQLARSLIPDIGGDDRIWSEYARTFFSAVTQQLIRAGARDDRTLHRLIRSADDDELRKLLAGTAAGPFLREGSEKMFGSLRSVASNAVRVLEHTIEQQSPPFSVRQWVREGVVPQTVGKGGALFLPYRASQIASLRSVISAWMRLGIFEAMDRPAGDQRLWFIVDELDALGAIDGLKDALSRLRKFGGRCVLGFQSIAQVSGTYGREVADTIVENCGNTLILRCSASERGGTSEFASKLIGQREVVHTTQSRTHTAKEWLPSVTTSQQVRIEPAIMASEIERLSDLSGFLKLASCPDWQRVQLTPVHYPLIARNREPHAAAMSPAPSPGGAVANSNGSALAKPVVGPLGGAELRD